MKVKDLLAALAYANLEAEVILQKDSEGNGYSPLQGADLEVVYVPDSSWDGSVYPTSWDADEAGFDEDEWAELQQTSRCVVLFPVN